MSGLEQRTTERDEAPVSGSAVIAFTGRSPGVDPKAVPPLEWPPIADVDLLDERRAPVPAFPLELLPEPWRGWVRTTALSKDAPVDYVAQSVLAAVAGSCGRGLSVWATPHWSVPLRLWLAAVGAPSSGAAPAAWGSEQAGGDDGSAMPSRLEPAAALAIASKWGVLGSSCIAVESSGVPAPVPSRIWAAWSSGPGLGSSGVDSRDSATGQSACEAAS